MWGRRKSGWNSNRGWGVAKKSVVPPQPPASPYQQWENYPASPGLSSEYPFQVVYSYNGITYLAMTTNQIFYSFSSKNTVTAGGGAGTKTIIYKLDQGNWTLHFDGTNTGLSSWFTTLIESNDDIYTDATFTSVYFAKTTV